MSGAGSDLAIHGGSPVASQPVHEVWPRLTPDLEACLVVQARDSLSIYDRSGIVQEFEDAFAGYVGVPRALATSSGTVALHSLYYGARIGPGDEVICCDYGFFPTGRFRWPALRLRSPTRPRPSWSLTCGASQPRWMPSGRSATRRVCCCSRTARMRTGHASPGRWWAAWATVRHGASKRRRPSGPERAGFSPLASRTCTSGHYC